MTNAQLKTQIDTQITNETVDFAITPAEVGGRMKDIVDYVDQETGSLPIKVKTVTLTKVQIESLFDTQIPVISGVPNKRILPIRMIAYSNNPTAAYIGGSGIILKYGALPTSILSCNTNLGSVGIGECQSLAAGSLQAGGFSSKGEAIYVKSTGSELSGGDGNLELTIFYLIV